MMVKLDAEVTRVFDEVALPRVLIRRFTMPVQRVAANQRRDSGLRAGFPAHHAIYSKMLSKRRFFRGNRSAFLCPSAHFNPTAATV
jgi:hypothetical protein